MRSRTFAPEFAAVANSWRAVAEPNRLYLGVLEYSDGTEVFRRVRSLPVLAQADGPTTARTALTNRPHPSPIRLFGTPSLLVFRAFDTAQLKISTAPQILHFPPTDGRLGKQQYQKDPFAYEPYDTRAYGSRALKQACTDGWVSERHH